jgi:hypothetical protein
VAQYLATVADPTAVATFGNRYVFGDLHQTEISIESRLNVALSPTLSFQTYLQPLVSVGRYASIRELARRKTYDFRAYGTDLGQVSAGPDAASLTIDPDAGGPARPFVLSRPDFNTKSLRLNCILRWEWRPGSTLFFVWTEDRHDLADPGDFAFGRNLDALVHAAPDDVVAVKVTWWLAR